MGRAPGRGSGRTRAGQVWHGASESRAMTGYRIFSVFYEAYLISRQGRRGARYGLGDPTAGNAAPSAPWGLFRGHWGPGGYLTPTAPFRGPGSAFYMGPERRKKAPGPCCRDCRDRSAGATANPTHFQSLKDLQQDHGHSYGHGYALATLPRPSHQRRFSLSIFNNNGHGQATPQERPFLPTPGGATAGPLGVPLLDGRVRLRHKTTAPTATAPLLGNGILAFIFDPVFLMPTLPCL